MHFSCRHVLITYIILIILSIVEQFIFGKNTEWYHAFLDKSLVTPHVQSCPKPIQLGYFDVAIDLDLLLPLKNSNVMADETMQTNFTIDYSTHNFWVIRYLNLCDFANILLQVDETNVQYPLSLCQLVNVDKFNEYSAKEENKSTDPNTDLSTKAITWSYNSKGIMVDPGFHILRVTPVLLGDHRLINASKLYNKIVTKDTFLGAQRQTSFWYMFTGYSNQNKLVEFFYRSRPYELYKYARYLKLLGYKKESIHTTKIAHKLMLNNRMIYQNDKSNFPFSQKTWSFQNEENKDPLFHFHHPPFTTNKNACNNPRQKYISFHPLVGTLDNQMNKIIQIISIAHILNRSLILPLLSINDNGTTTIPFGRIFDINHLGKKLAGLLCFVENRTAVTADSKIFRVVHTENAPLDWYRREFNKLSLRSITHLHFSCPYSYKDADIVQFYGARAITLEHRIRVALIFEQILTKVAYNVIDQLMNLGRNTYGQNYFMAIHASLNARWKKFSISEERLFAYKADLWVPPKQIQQRIDGLDKLRNTNVIYLAAYVSINNDDTDDSSISHLQQYLKLNHIPVTFSNFSDPYNISKMPQLLQSAVDYIICANSSDFIGNVYSDFSQMVTRHRGEQSVKPSYIYNAYDARISNIVKLRTDNGLLHEPFGISTKLTRDNSVKMNSKNDGNGAAELPRLHLVNAYHESLKSLYKLSSWPFEIDRIHAQKNGTAWSFQVYEKFPILNTIKTFCDHIVGVVNDENGTTNGVIVKKHRRQCLHYAQKTTINILRHFNSPAQTQKRLLLRFSQKQNDNLKTLEEIGYEIYNSYSVNMLLFDKFFSDLRFTSNLKILQLGVSNTDSINLLYRYFPFAKIYAMEDETLWPECGPYKNVINRDFGCQYNDRVTIFQGSYSDENFMSGILYHAVKSVDIIIHNSEYSLNLDKDTYVLFNRLFKYLLKENGIYFINGYNNYVKEEIILHNMKKENTQIESLLYEGKIMAIKKKKKKVVAVEELTTGQSSNYFDTAACVAINAAKFKYPWYQPSLRRISKFSSIISSSSSSSATKIEKHLVISRYKEDLSWIVKWKSHLQIDKIFIYNKNEDEGELKVFLNLYGNNPDLFIMQLPNVGRESHSWLHHMTRKDVTFGHVNIFVQGTPEVSLSTLENDLKRHKRVQYISLYDDTQDQEKCTCYPFCFQYDIQESHVKVMHEFCKIYDSINIYGPSCVEYTSSLRGEFVLSDERIREFLSSPSYRNLKIKTRVLDALSNSSDPIEGHYLERLWNLLFNHADWDRSYFCNMFYS